MIPSERAAPTARRHSRQQWYRTDRHENLLNFPWFPRGAWVETPGGLDAAAILSKTPARVRLFLRETATQLMNVVNLYQPNTGCVVLPAHDLGVIVWRKRQ